MGRFTIFFRVSAITVSLSCLIFPKIGIAQFGSLGRSVLDWPTGVTVYKPAKSFNGYTVIVPYRSSQAFLIDMAGRVVHTWYADPKDHSEAWFFERISNGHWFGLLQAPGSLGASEEEGNSAITELDYDGGMVWKYPAPQRMRLTHDMARTAQGNTFVIAVVNRRVPHISKQQIADTWIIEVNYAKEIIWEWKMADHFDEFGFDAATKAKVYEKGGDIFHTNSVQVLPENDLALHDTRFRPGNLLLSNRSNSLIFVVDRKTGDIVWKWGLGRNGLVGQHDPRMLQNGDMLVYDDGGQADFPLRQRSYTRLVEVSPRTNQIVWQYMSDAYSYRPTSKFFSYDWGSVQRLPNGNTLSLDCHKGRIFEITPQGEIVWEYISPFSWGDGTRDVDSGMYRVYRYPYHDFPEVSKDFSQTDGHLGYVPAKIPIPPLLGLPSPE